MFFHLLSRAQDCRNALQARMMIAENIPSLLKSDYSLTAYYQQLTTIFGVSISSVQKLGMEQALLALNNNKEAQLEL